MKTDLIIPLDGFLREKPKLTHPALLVVTAHSGWRVAIGQVTLTAVQ